MHRQHLHPFPHQPRLVLNLPPRYQFQPPQYHLPPPRHPRLIIRRFRYRLLQHLPQLHCLLL
jgi:hypothetical protein